MVKFSGEITSQEDLFIDGSIEGTISLREHSLTVGPSGKIKATIIAKAVIVAGEVRGDVRASDRIVLNSTARLTGDLRAPKVQLDEGCQFKGGIEMDDKNVIEPVRPRSSGYKPAADKPRENSPPSASPGAFPTK